MQKILIASLLTLALAGCAVEQGNYVQPAVQVQRGQTLPAMDSVIDASVHVLKQKYPPAKSALKINVTEDSISSPLIEALRQAGYAVYEIYPEPQFKTADTPKKPVVPDSAQSLVYVFDSLDRGLSLYRLVMTVDKTRIAGVFRLENGQFKQVSPWSVF